MSKVLNSLHEIHGEQAPAVLQKTMKCNIVFPEGFEVVDNGEHYIISNGKESMKCPLFAIKEVIRALNIFC